MLYVLISHEAPGEPSVGEDAVVVGWREEWAFSSLVAAVTLVGGSRASASGLVWTAKCVSLVQVVKSQTSLMCLLPWLHPGTDWAL